MVEVVPTIHSLVGASGFNRWSKCPGSVPLIREQGACSDEEGEPSGSSEFAREGTAAHELAGWCLQQDREPWEIFGEPIQVEGHDILVDEEMVDGVQEYVNFCRNLVAKRGKGATVWVEEAFHRPEWHPDFYGTSDFGVIARAVGEVDIVDFKYGKGIYVEPEWNGQLLYYAAGALDTHNLLDQVAWRINLHIVQPRADRGEGIIRSWTISSNELRNWTFTTLLPAMRATDDPEALLVPGEHCRWCPVKERCPALRGAFEEAEQHVAKHGDGRRLLEKFSPEELADAYNKSRAIRQFLKAIEEETYQRLAAGKQVPGYKLVRKSSPRVWHPNTLQKRIEVFGKRSVYEVRERSPAQLEQKLTPEQKTELRKFCFSPDTGLTVAPKSDNRGEVQPRSASDVFASVPFEGD